MWFIALFVFLIFMNPIFPFLGVVRKSGVPPATTLIVTPLVATPIIATPLAGNTATGTHYLTSGLPQVVTMRKTLETTLSKPIIPISQIAVAKKKTLTHQDSGVSYSKTEVVKKPIANLNHLVEVGNTLVPIHIL